MLNGRTVQEHLLELATASRFHRVNMICDFSVTKLSNNININPGNYDEQN